MGSAPERSCAICRTKAPQTELTRWVVVDGIAQQNKQEGRGYYSCSKCADKAKMVIEGRNQARNDKSNDKRRA